MNSNRKGKRGEREGVELLKELWPGAKRNLSQSRTAKAEGPDVLGVPYHVEIKVGSAANANPRKALKQAERDGGTEDALALTRVDREDWVVSMRWETFAMLHEALNTRNILNRGLLEDLKRLEAEASAARSVAVRVAKAGADVAMAGGLVVDEKPWVPMPTAERKALEDLVADFAQRGNGGAPR